MVTREPIPTSQRRSSGRGRADRRSGVRAGVHRAGPAQPRRGVSLAGVAETAWPFVTGTLVGWLLSRVAPPDRHRAHRPRRMVCTVVVGMALRKATSAGIAVSFIVVASLVTALLLGVAGGPGGAHRRRGGTPNR